VELEKKKIKSYDRLIFGFIVIFLLSMTNSIFFNQIGYFGALLVLLIKWYKSKEKIFSNVGLEIPFILFLIAELISALFSWNQSQAFANFSKRLLLIPVVYLIAFTADDIKKAKAYFNIFISAAVITVLVYLGFAYRHYILQLYQLESKGPSPFQYVMTAGGLMSFIVVILFSFIVNEKSELKIKLLQVIGFVISLIALISSYTRAAWLGAAFGMFLILAIKRKWFVLLPAVLVIILFIVFSKSESKILIYHVNNEPPNLIKELNTDGRARDVFPINSDTLLVADYEEGIKLIVDDKVIQTIPTPSPATRTWHWKNNYYVVYLIDSRQFLLRMNDTLNVVKIFTSPGLTKDLELKKEKYFVADYDTGLTVFTLEGDSILSKTYSELIGITRIDFQDSILTAYNAKSSSLNFYRFDNKLKLIDSINIETGIGLLWIHQGHTFFQTESELLHFYVTHNEVKTLDSYNIQGLYRMRFLGSRLYGITTNGELFKGLITEDNFAINKIYECGIVPSDFHFRDSTIYLTMSKRNRILSMIDPYHETNLERINQWKTGWNIFKDNPVFGVGDIDLKDVYAHYKEYYLKENFGHLHNNYVHFLVILGGFGIIIVFYLLIKIFLTHLKIYNSVKQIPFASSYTLGALASFAGFLVSGLAEWNFGDQEIITIVWFLLGLNIAFYRSLKIDSKIK